MVCYRPMQAFLVKNWKTGKNRVVFPNKRRKISRAVDAVEDNCEIAGDIKLPCSYCVGCRLEYSRQWSLRCVHEASCYQSNCFITLTYDNAHLPEHGSLVVEHFQGFMKRLRERYSDVKMKYYHCGEYGDKLGRPHYHVLLFGFDFADKVYKCSRRGNQYFESQILDKIWGHGKCILGNLTLQSAGYVARYAVKKQYGMKKSFGKRIDEYATMSNGIGRQWFYRNYQDVYANDFIIVLNAKNQPVKHKPPRRYDEWFKEIDPVRYAEIKRNRMDLAESLPEQSEDRLLVREECKNLCLTRLFREYDKVSNYLDPVSNPPYNPFDEFSPPDI